MDRSSWKSSFDFVFLVCKVPRCFLIKYKVSFFNQITPPPPKKRCLSTVVVVFVQFFTKNHSESISSPDQEYKKAKDNLPGNCGCGKSAPIGR